MDKVSDALKTGTKLQNGLYTIRKVLGQGATGITYLADMQHSVERSLGGFSTNIEVAIKEFYMKKDCQRGVTTLNVVIPNSKNTAQVGQYKESFIKEARRISRLSHPNIVHVLEVFTENDTVYYAMQYIRGGSIKDIMEKKGALPEKVALKYAGQIASALAYMHVKKHMCHYDLKPGNIMIDSNDNALLIDFGIAKNYDEQGNETSTTPPGLTKGYAPLEQYASISEFSPYSDVYSLGATLYSMLTNETPPEPMTWISTEFPQCPQNVSPQTWNIVTSAMKLSTSERIDMETFKNEVYKIIGDNDSADQNGDSVTTDGGTNEEETLYFKTSDNENNAEETIYQDKEDIVPLATPSKTETKKKDKKQAATKKTWKGGSGKMFVGVALLTAVLVVCVFFGYKFVKSNIIGKDADLLKEMVKEQAIYDTNGQVIMTYSGEVENGKPQGKGVLVYKTDKDKDRYEGRFLNGLREDSLAALYFKNGDVYRGSFIEDRFATGTYFVAETGEYFRGVFHDNKPCKGYWYDKNHNIIEEVKN